MEVTAVKNQKEQNKSKKVKHRLKEHIKHLTHKIEDVKMNPIQPPAMRQKNTNNKENVSKEKPA